MKTSADTITNIFNGIIAKAEVLSTTGGWPYRLAQYHCPCWPERYATPKAE